MNRGNRPRYSRISGSSYASRLLNRAGDGSTLSLDFTTGVLDPRLTFTRTGNATFINSSGLVQWADSNMLRNSSWSDANTTPTNWGAALNGSGAVTIPSTGVRTCAVTTSGWSYLYDGGLSLAGGINYMASFDVTAATGSPTIGTIVSATSGSSNFVYYVDGTKVTSSYAITAACNVTMLFLAGSGGALIRQGIGADGVAVTNKSLSMTNPRVCPSAMPASAAPATITVPTYYQSVSTSAGYYAPRFDYDPTTLAPSGLLIEGSATNVITGITAGAGLTLTANAIASPSGVVDANLFTKTNTTTPCYVVWAYSLTPAANTTYTASMFVKRGNVDMTTSLEYNNSANWGAVSWVVNFNVTSTNVTVGTTSGGATGRVEPYRDGWYRVIATFTTGATTPTAGGNILSKVSGTTNDTIYIWGGQLEAGSGASSYIPTGASTASRAADSCVMTGTNFSSWFNASAGTIFVNYGARINTGSNRVYTFASTDSTNQIFETIGNGTALNVYSSSSFVAQIGNTGNTAAKYAAAYSVNDYAVSVAGSNAATDTLGALPVSIAKLIIGDSNTGTVANNGPIASFKYWPTRLSNAQLQSLTT